MSTPASLALPPGVRRSRAGELAALRAGEGPPVLLVPGYTGSKEDFVYLLPLLATAGFGAVAVDQLGQWESPKPADARAYTVGGLADAVTGAITDLGPPVHLVGHSFGGLVCRDVVIRRPELARSLVLLGSGPAALAGTRGSVVQLLRPLLEQQGLAAVWQASEALAAQDPRRAERPAGVRAFLEARFMSHTDLALAAMGEALISEPDRVDELRTAYEGPLLVAHGQDDDAWSPAEQAAMAQRLGAAYEVVAGAVHSPAAEAPEATAQVLLRFWGRP